MSDVTPTHNPDVLDCLANLSNDEVFTPPRVANAMLDLLPQSLFADPEATFLDPCCKSGVFLREIAKRLLVGLEPTFPDLQARLDHILRRQLFGLAITELTALTSRRTLYCSKVADGRYALSHFDAPEGNILFPETRHEWVNGRCRLCGVSQDTLKDRKETHAYAFIHGINPERLFKMKFDVIIGNPPYQLATSGTSAQAIPLYNRFVTQAISLKPRYLCMIIPARWYTGGMGLDAFRAEMLTDRRMRELHDFLNSSECFAGVEIKGGVCYFLWDSKYSGDCAIYTHSNRAVVAAGKRPLLEKGLDTFIRHEHGVNIVRKVAARGEPSFSSLVNPQKFFDLPTKFRGSETASGASDIRVFQRNGIGYINANEVPARREWITKWKIYISEAYGAGEDFPHQILGVPLLGEPPSVCTETYITIGPFDNRCQTVNAMGYITTKFFRFLVMLKKLTQHASAKVYQLVPLQDFSKPWTDEALYAKYGLSAEEITFIEAMVKPMEV